MNVLLNEIRRCDSNAASVLEKRDFRTDSEIKSLTREDLLELFPKPEELKLRKNILKIIKQNPAEQLLQNLRGFIPDNSIKDALSTNGVLVDYLQLLKDMKAQVDNVQSFLEAHIGFLEDIKAQPPQNNDPDSLAENQSAGRPGTSSFDSYSCSQGAQVTVKYKMVVSGKTFDAHQQILAKVKSSGQQLNLVDTQCSEDCQIVFVFCPIVSRTGTDVEAAMKMVTGDKPVILVLMHHAHKPKHVATTGTWDDNPRISQHFNVFYHERVRGLLTCRENNEAISGIWTEVLKYGVSTVPREYSAGTGSLQSSPSVSINNNIGSQSEKRETGGFFSMFYQK